MSCHRTEKTNVNFNSFIVLALLRFAPLMYDLKRKQKNYLNFSRVLLIYYKIILKQKMLMTGCAVYDDTNIKIIQNATYCVNMNCRL